MLNEVKVGSRAVSWYAVGTDEGVPVLVIHGAGGNAAVWWQQVEAWSVTRRVIALDLPGFGRSAPPPPSDFSGMLIETAEAVLDAAGADRVDVVAQSLGGWAGLRLALERPDRVRRLVLCCTMAGVAHPPALAAFQASLGKMDERGPASLAFSPAFRQRHPARAYVYDQVNAFNPPLPPELGGLAFAPETLLPLAQLERLNCPVLLVAGEGDAIWPPASLEGIVDAIPDARMTIIPDAGHSPYFEQPEMFNRTVAAFLDAA